MYIDPHELNRLAQEKFQDEYKRAQEARLLREAFPPRPVRTRVAHLLQRLALRLDPQSGARPVAANQSCT